MKLEKNHYDFLLKNIGRILEEGRKKAIQSVNQILVQTYWTIGKEIIEYEQQGNKRAEYGETLLSDISRDLKNKYGKGFSISNLQYMRLLYVKYQNHQTMSGKLSWSHYIEILSLEDDLEKGKCLLMKTQNL